MTFDLRDFRRFSSDFDIIEGAFSDGKFGCNYSEATVRFIDVCSY